MQVAEVDGRTSAGNAGGVLGDAKVLDALGCCRLCHLLNRAVGMARSNGVRMEVKEEGWPLSPLPLKGESGMYWTC